MHTNDQASLADGPVGRLALAAHALAVTGRAAILDYRLRLFANERTAAETVAKAVDDIQTNPLIQKEFCGSSLLLTVGEITSGYHHGYSMLGQTGPSTLDGLRPQLNTLERILRQSGVHDWWWEPLHKMQVVTQTAEGIRLDLDAPQYDTGSAWWTPPRMRSTVMTTRGPVVYQDQGSQPASADQYAPKEPVDQSAPRDPIGPTTPTVVVYPSVAAVTGEDLATDNPLTAPFTLPEGPIYEINGPQAFVDLVERYPHPWTDSYGEWEKMTGGHGPWVGPDWQAVAADFSGVHLSVAAYLSTAYRAFKTQSGTAVLAGWDPDATVWFNQAVSVNWGGQEGLAKSAHR